MVFGQALIFFPGFPWNFYQKGSTIGSRFGSGVPLLTVCWGFTLKRLGFTLVPRLWFNTFSREYLVLLPSFAQVQGMGLGPSGIFFGTPFLKERFGV